MASLEEIRAERLKKLDLLKSKGMNPYPIATKRSLSVEQALASFAKLEKAKKKITLAGRVMAIRGQGALVFFNIRDGESTIQGLLKRGELDEDLLTLFQDAIDIGDFIECTGTLFVTNRKEKTLLVKDWKVLSKSLRPLPDKWHGLQDVEERFRKRYLDTLMSEEVRARFVVRSRVITAIRSFLDEAGYVEVETPLLQSLAGGALAQPFRTHHNALDIDLSLRIAPELYLKKLLVGGFPRVYELGRNFRNEGIDLTHNPEFTMLEFYAAYETAATQMAFVEKMIKAVVKQIYKKSLVPFGEGTIDISKKFAVISFFDLFKRYAAIENPETMTREEWALVAERNGVRVEPHEAVEKIMDNVYKKTCRPKIINPTFIID